MSRDTPVTPYTRLPVSTDSAIRDRSRDCHNLRQSTAICHILPTCFYYNICDIRNVRNFCRILPSLLNSAKFCQDYDLKPILPYIYINWATKLIIYTLFSRFLISFFYIMSWLYYIVYIYSLIISTLLYIIATYTYSVILYYINHLYYCIKYKTNLKPL